MPRKFLASKLGQIRLGGRSVKIYLIGRQGKSNSSRLLAGKKTWNKLTRIICGAEPRSENMNGFGAEPHD